MTGTTRAAPMTAVLEEIYLTAFKSFRNAVLPILPLTVLTGRNSSGKSNALDGIEVLSRLASGEELGDALDGRRREGGPVRGGSRGCVPHGRKSFKLGCSVRVARGTGRLARRYRLDVEVQVEPELRILHEHLRGPGPALESGVIEQRDLLWTRPPTADDAGLYAEIFNGKRGHNPTTHFRDTRLLTSQLPARFSPQNRAEKAVADGTEAVTAALRGAFHLDPVPHLMREYVPERDAVLRRTGANLSAAIAHLAMTDRTSFDRLVHLVREVADEAITGIETTPSALGDVMLALREGPQRYQVTPAREMSDGLLRFIAIATALLTANRGLDIDPGLVPQGGLTSGVLVVVEELENGLHPAQAELVLRLIRETSEQLQTKVALTTHSPALLNALSGPQSRDVIVCYRNQETGLSELRRMEELPGYATAMAAGRLGDVIASGRLAAPEPDASDYAAFNRLLGVE
jgi:predicted ATPase